MNFIHPRLKLHGFILYENDLFFAFETKDNQLDFNSLEIHNFDMENFEYNFKQKAEVIPRKNLTENDPIKKCIF